MVTTLLTVLSLASASSHTMDSIVVESVATAINERIGIYPSCREVTFCIKIVYTGQSGEADDSKERATVGRTSWKELDKGYILISLHTAQLSSHHARIVLIHEIGHALGLDHVANEKSVMAEMPRDELTTGQAVREVARMYRDMQRRSDRQKH